MDINRDNLLTAYALRATSKVGFTQEYAKGLNRLAKLACKVETWRLVPDVKLYRLGGDVGLFTHKGMGDYYGCPFIGLYEKVIEMDDDTSILYITGYVLYNNSLSTPISFPEHMMTEL